MELFANFLPYVNVATAVVAAASCIANLTKTKKDDKIVGAIDKVIQKLALNFR